MASTNSLNTAHTSSLAATLPPELLRPIFDLAVHNNDSFSKVDLALVCRSWFLASSLHSAFTVSTASSCARLATWLEQTNKGDIVRSLVVHYNAEDPGVVSALAALLRTCHRVTELAIILYGYSQEDQRGQRQFLTRSDEDEELVQALEGLKDLKTVQIGGQHMFDSECASYDRLMTAWTHLRSIQLNHIGFWNRVSTDPHRIVPNNVTTVVSIFGRLCSSLVDLLYHSRHSLKTVYLRTPSFQAEDVNILRLALEDAPALESLWIGNSFQMIAEGEPLFRFDMMAPKLNQMRSLCMDELCIDPTTVFGLLGSMTRLEAFALFSDQVVDEAKVARYKLKDLLDALPKLKQLAFLSLPRSLQLRWSIETLDGTTNLNGLVELCALCERQGVDLSFDE